MLRILYYLGFLIFLTFLTLGILSIKPIKAHADLETKAKTLLKLIPEKKTVVKPPEPVVIPETPPEALVEVVAPVYVPPAYQSGIVENCGDDYYANWIYMHESSCRLDARNAQGCLGIGQACPGSKLTNVCPDLNYECQNGFFTNYVNARYGGWQGAYNFWQSHNWY